jgi:hypothetical protein
MENVSAALPAGGDAGIHMGKWTPEKMLWWSSGSSDGSVYGITGSVL